MPAFVSRDSVAAPDGAAADDRPADGRAAAGLVARARFFATAAHAAVGQTRKYTGEPYILHPAAVAHLVASVGGSPAQLAAAWLHDTVEDTAVSLADIAANFGPYVAALVEQLTDVSRPADGNRARRKAIDRAHIAMASPEAKTIKLADLIDNSSSIIAGDAKFAVVYMREKAALLEVLREGSAVLWQRAADIVAAWQEAQAPADPAPAGPVPADSGAAPWPERDGPERDGMGTGARRR